MVLDTSLLNTQQYKEHIKGEVEQSRERSSAPLHLSVVAIEKGAFGLPSTTVANNNNYYFFFFFISQSKECLEAYQLKCRVDNNKNEDVVHK